SGTLTPKNALVDGSYDITYTVTNAAGNESVQSDKLTLQIDGSLVAKPSAPTAYVDNVGDYTSDNNTSSVTDDGTPGIKIGALSVGNVAKLYVNGVAVDATYNNALGTLTPTVALTDGAYDITYTVTNAAGNESVQ